MMDPEPRNPKEELNDALLILDHRIRQVEKQVTKLRIEMKKLEADFDAVVKALP